MKKRFLPLISAIISIFISWYASIMPLAWVTQKDISDKYFSLLTPWAFTFSIWSIIYISWIVVSIMILLKKIEITKSENYLFSLSMLISSSWLFPWHYNIIPLSLVIMFILLFDLIYLFKKSLKWNKIFSYTIQLFMWWILVASLLNISVFLLSEKVDIWLIRTNFILTIWLISNVFLLLKYKSYISTFVFIWALFWIYMWHDNLILRNLVIAHFIIIFSTLLINKFKKIYK